ncbi:Natterin-1 [Merluccius polli]|uniref:Natterin-1 n=1 Tax=Merluccius polli TaxID=89951 RepID=A0AA47NCF0_MERPO|nr:Natterin-1 [Merluccius polli]
MLPVQELLLKPELEDVVPSMDAPSTAAPREMDPRGGGPQDPPPVRGEREPPVGDVGLQHLRRAHRLRCKVNCEAGFYNPSKGDLEHTSSKFQVLVNMDHFEFLGWKEDSYGSVPPHAVRTCPDVDIFVGNN